MIWSAVVVCPTLDPERLVSKFLPTYDDVVAAAGRLHGVAIETPLVESLRLNARLGLRVLFKAECLQTIGAFKIRGAYNAIAQLDRERHPGGVVACSSGNHAQGVARAARLLGVQALVVMPRDAPRLKIDRTKADGAHVHLYDREREDRDALALDFCRTRRAAFIHPFDDRQVIAGQATVGLEIVTQATARGVTPQCVFVPCSGGGLTSGISLAMAKHFPSCEIFTVEPEGFDDFARSLASGRREVNARAAGSLCDALQSPAPGELTFAIARETVAGGVAVADSVALRGLNVAFDDLKLVLEPSGAIALGAILERAPLLKGKTVICVLSGGNVDRAAFARYLLSA